MRRRTRQDFEYELIDTGVFDDDRYFDVFVEYAKSSPEDCFILITVANRGPETATVHLLPTLWFRNTWSWWPEPKKPGLAAAQAANGTSAVKAWHPDLGDRWLYCDGAPRLLFTENETNTERLFDTPNTCPHVKDAFHAFVVHGQADAVNPAQVGTKAAAHYLLDVGAGQSVTVRLCLTGSSQSRPFAAFEKTFEARRSEADEFYRCHTPESASEDAAQVIRQAFGGLFWTKQYFFFDVSMWLREHGVHPLHSPASVSTRNRHWFHMLNDDVISMPDKWEYPWYAAWDLAFHAVALTGVDPDFAKHQLSLMLKPRYQHSNGQLPAYEWNFGDVNPPVHAWATLVTVPHGAGEPRQRGPRVPQALLQQARRQLYVVGQPQGPPGKERVRGGLPRPRQHRRVRPERRAAHGGAPRAGRRHCMDGDVLPEHAGDRDRACDPRRQLRGACLQVCGTPAVDRRRHEQGGRRRHVGRRGRFLLRRPAVAGRTRGAPQGPLPRRAAAPLCNDGHRTGAARARAASSRCAPDAPPPHSGTLGRHSPGWSRQFVGPDHRGCGRAQTGCGGSSHACWTNRSS